MLIHCPVTIFCSSNLKSHSSGLHIPESLGTETSSKSRSYEPTPIASNYILFHIPTTWKVRCCTLLQKQRSLKMHVHEPDSIKSTAGMLSGTTSTVNIPDLLFRGKRLHGYHLRDYWGSLDSTGRADLMQVVKRPACVVFPLAAHCAEKLKSL